MKELRQSLVLVWLVVSVAGGVAAAAPFVLRDAVLFDVFPQCPERARGSRCIACGLTTGFAAIGDGRWSEAQTANPAAVPLWSLFTLNFGVAAAYAVMWARTKKSVRRN